MGTTKREGKDERGVSPPVPLPKRSPSPRPNYLKATATNSTLEACSRAKKAVVPLPSTNAMTPDRGGRLTRIKSLERPPSIPQPSRSLSLDGVKNKTLRSPSSLLRGSVLVGAMSPRPKPGGNAIVTTTSPSPKSGGTTVAAATSQRPKRRPAVAISTSPKSKPEVAAATDRTIKLQGRVLTSPARRRSSSKATSQKDSNSGCRSSPNIGETKPQVQEVVPVTMVTPEEAETKLEQQYLLDPLMKAEDDGRMPDLPEPVREVEPIAIDEKDAVVAVEHNGPVEQAPKDVGEEEVVRRQAKEALAYNDVIEETRSKLVEKKKSKVLALVGAFETVIALQEPETPVQAPAQTNQGANGAIVDMATTTTTTTSTGDAEQDASSHKEGNDARFDEDDEPICIPLVPV